MSDHGVDWKVLRWENAGPQALVCDLSVGSVVVRGVRVAEAADKSKVETTIPSSDEAGRPIEAPCRDKLDEIAKALFYGVEEDV